MTKASYRPDVDGLRAVAILPVLLFHSGLQGFPGGYVGVDIFFVISGYVIALSLQRDLEAGQFSIAGFYERRMRRLLPALMAVLGLTFLAALFVAPPVYFRPFATSLIYASGFAANIFFWRNDGYFGADSVFRPLLHTWSLGVEEQYYIVAPVFIFLVFRFLRGRWAWAIAPVLAVSFALSVYATSPKFYELNFFSLPTRAWELLLGALIALAPPPMIAYRVVREVLAVLALAMIGAAVFMYNSVTPFPGLAAVPPCLGTAILIYLGSAPDRPLVSRALAWRPFVFIGLISYALYLVHWPLITISRFLLMRQFTPFEAVLVIAASVVVAVLLHFTIERPLRHFPARRRVVFAVSFVAILGAMAAGLAGPRVNAFLYKESPLAHYKPDWNLLTGPYRVGKCMLRGHQSHNDWRLDQCVRSNGAGGDILLWGDSLAAHYAPGVEANAGAIDGRVIQYTVEGCPPVLSFHRFDAPHCDALTKHALQIISQGKIKRVVIAAAWGHYLDRRVVSEVDSTLEVLHRMGVETTVIGQSPMFYMEPFIIEARQAPVGASDVWTQVDPFAAKTNAALRASAERWGAAFVDPIASVCRQGRCPTRLNGQELFLDYGHYTPVGGAYAVRAYFPYMDHSRAAAPAISSAP